MMKSVVEQADVLRRDGNRLRCRNRRFSKERPASALDFEVVARERTQVALCTRAPLQMVHDIRWRVGPDVFWPHQNMHFGACNAAARICQKLSKPEV